LSSPPNIRGDQIEGDEMGKTCGMDKGEENAWSFGEETSRKEVT
jgi:hypothetical protein